MRAVSATEASCRFSELLDATEAGESLTITRGNRPIAEMRPVRRLTGRDLRAALAETSPPDDRFATDIVEAVANLTKEGVNPGADA